MKKSIGNLCLVGGVMLAALAAGESQRVSRAMEVNGGLLGKTVHTAISTQYQTQFPGIAVYLDRTLEAGKIIEPADIEWLLSIQAEEVLVLRRAINAEVLPTGPQLLGRVLSGPVLLGAEMEEISPGRVIGSAFIERLAATDLTSLTIEAETEVGRKILPWPLEDDVARPEGITLKDSKLSQKVSLPARLKESSYVDDAVLQRLEASGITEVSVKIPKHWTFDQWADRWRFLVGIALIFCGVMMRRSKPTAQAVEEERMEVIRVASALVELEGEVEQLVLQSKDLSPEELHARIDPLLTGPVYFIAEGRYSIRQAHGSKVFGAVMDAFSRGERKLNRAWSAAVDEHAEESRASLAAGLPALREAREALPGTVPPSPARFEPEGEHMPLPPDVPVAGAEHWADDDGDEPV